MGGFSWLVRRPAAASDPTHALFAAQSHSIVDNLVSLLRHSPAWNCSVKLSGFQSLIISVNSRFRVPSRHPPMASALLNVAESRCGAVAVGRAYLLPPLSFGGASSARPWLRFHTSLIEPDVAC